MTVKRRDFIKGCCAGIAALCGSQVGNLSFASGSPSGRDVVVTVFLRGGMDGLNFLVPYDDPDYHSAREQLALWPGDVLDLDGYFGLHSKAAPLKELYDEGHLALIPASGLPVSNRSHFQAQDLIERGMVDSSGYARGGWLARHLETVSQHDAFDGVSFGSSLATSFESYPHAVAMSSLSSFTLAGAWNQIDDIRRSLRGMWSADPDYAPVASRTLDIADILDANPVAGYVPANEVEYSTGSFGKTMASIAQLIRMDLGLQAATVDLGGWDTHQEQAGSDPASGSYAAKVLELSEGLHDFWNDLSDHHGRLTVVVMSEFGRRVKENDNRGTDHGHGGLMMVLSSDISEKKIWGPWPGLASEQLFERVDLEVTTDYRTVLSEILLARLNQHNLSGIFPGYSFQNPLGIFDITTSLGHWSVL